MRILLLTLYFQPDISANSAVMSRLAKQFTKDGHQVTAVTAFPHYSTNYIWDNHKGHIHQKENHGDDLVIHRVYLYVPKRKNNILGRLLNYTSFNCLSTIAGLFAGPYDAILAPSPPLTIGLSAYLISRLRGVPYIYNVQDIYPDIAVRLGILKNPQLIHFFSAMERFVYKHAAAVSVLSDGFRRNLSNKGIPSDKISIIPNFVDSSFVHPLPRHNSFSQAQGLDDRYVVMFAGNVGSSQGLDIVLDVAQQLASLPEILFLIVGTGVAKPALLEKAKRLGLESVRFLPFQPTEAVPEMYATSDLCLVPLKRGIAHESVPSKVYTIMAAGKPMVAAVDPDSDTWQFISDTGCGSVVPPEDAEAMAGAILALYRDQATANEMGVRGRRRVEQEFTPEIIARKYEALFRDVIGGIKPAPAEESLQGSVSDD